MNNTLNIGRISDGFVLDHIQAGKRYGHLQIPTSGQAGLLCSHHQECQK